MLREDVALLEFDGASPEEEDVFDGFRRIRDLTIEALKRKPAFSKVGLTSC